MKKLYQVTLKTMVTNHFKMEKQGKQAKMGKTKSGPGSDLCRPPTTVLQDGQSGDRFVLWRPALGNFNPESLDDDES